MKNHYSILFILLNFLTQTSLACNFVFLVPPAKNTCGKNAGTRFSTQVACKGVDGADCYLNARPEVFKSHCEDYQKHGKCAPCLIDSCSSVRIDEKSGYVFSGVSNMGVIDMKQTISQSKYCYDEGPPSPVTVDTKLNVAKFEKIETSEAFDQCFPSPGVNQDQHAQKHDLKKNRPVQGQSVHGAKQ